jgi:hypothetical protein
MDMRLDALSAVRIVAGPRKWMVNDDARGDARTISAQRESIAISINDFN